MFRVELSELAQRFLDKLDTHTSERILERLKRLSAEPVPSDTKFIGRDNDEKVFRFRIGEFRALYKVKDAEQIVLVAKIDKRPRVYDR